MKKLKVKGWKKMKKMKIVRMEIIEKKGWKKVKKKVGRK